MIGTERIIKGYIGGSDAVRVHGSWETATFRKFWEERLTGEKSGDGWAGDTIHTATGNIMESEILRALKIPEDKWSVFFPPTDTIAGINTDAYDGPNPKGTRGAGIYHEIKTVLWDTAAKWIFGSAISSSYIYQVQHGLFVTGAEEAKLHVCLMTLAEKHNPFSIENVEERIHTFHFHRSYFDKTAVTMAMYGAMMAHLTECYRKGVFPTDAQKKKILNSFS